MKKILLILFCLFGVTAKSQIITVSLDGSGNFSSIQSAVNYAKNGDTILIFPGVYIESVDMLGKSLTVGSLTLTTGVIDYRDSTIIDANYSGSCFKVFNSTDTCEINGVTLINGSGTSLTVDYGGGVYILDSKSLVKNCIIKDHIVFGNGGGIYLQNSYLYISNTTIKKCYAYSTGGGISFGSGILEFDSVNRCNIYMNYAPRGTDFLKGYQCPPISIYLDTFTVLNPTSYYLKSSMLNGYPNNDIDASINYGFLTPVNQDLFISPEGNNNNSGLTEDEPLKDIYFALLKIKSDTIQSNSINIAEGIYSVSTGERFPIALKSNVNLIGTETNSVVFDAEEYTYHMLGNPLTDNYMIKNITLKNGNGEVSFASGCGSTIIFDNHNSLFENVHFTENYGVTPTCLRIARSNNIHLVNTIFSENIGGSTVKITTSYNTGSQYPPFTADTVYFRNCILEHNLPDYSHPYGFGGGIVVQGIATHRDSMVCILENCLITDNDKRVSTAGQPAASALLVLFGAKTFVINSTIGNNYSSSSMGSTIGVSDASTINIYNSIVYGNEPSQLYIYDALEMDTSYLNIYNSLVQDGEDGINIYTPLSNLHYDLSNFDLIPYWDTLGTYPYSLTPESPCIDAGTVDLPEGLELPETDILGNPRIWNNSIDMGAYEYGPWVGMRKKEINESENIIFVYPNPFAEKCTIEGFSYESGEYLLRIYNAYGAFVRKIYRTIYKGSQFALTWDGKDENGKTLKSGIYFIEIEFNSKVLGSIKVLKTK